MPASAPPLFARVFLGFAVLLRYVFDPAFAAAVEQRRRGQAATPPDRPSAPPPTALQEAAPDAALQLLGLLQRDGRLVDFLQEDVAGYSDAQVGAAARVVHEGCRKTLREHFVLAPVRAEDEGARITLERGFDAGAVRLAGHVVGEPPFTGTLIHRGWQALEVRLPKLAPGHELRVVAPAEVEL
jgi:hypothetical protein